MDQALNVMKEERNKTADVALTLDYMSYSTYMQGNIRHALNLTDQWLSLDPEHERAQNNKKYYPQMLDDEDTASKKGDDGDANPEGATKGSYTFRNKRQLDEYRSSDEFATYEALCRGEDTHVYKHAHLLTCQYKRHHPMFYISPLKEETHYLDPWIVTYP